MIQLQTSVLIVDNSGATRGRCIKVLSPVGSFFANIGDVILVSITSSNLSGLRSSSGPRKGDVFRAVVVRSRRVGKAESGLLLSNRWDSNAVVLVKNLGSDEHIPVGSRIRGPVSHKLALRAGCQRLISLARSRS